MYSTTAIEKLPSEEQTQNLKTRCYFSFIGFVIEWWRVESLSLFISAVFTIALAWVLWFYNGKEQPQPRYGVTLNGLVAIFSIIIKATLLFPITNALAQLKFNWFRNKPTTLLDFEVLDAASRGPWGSVEFLAHTKQMYFILSQVYLIFTWGNFTDEIIF
jgi:hypothetical protein